MTCPRCGNLSVNVCVKTKKYARLLVFDWKATIDDFIDCVDAISSNINSDYWQGEDVMAIFFNEFNRYKAKAQ